MTPVASYQKPTSIDTTWCKSTLSRLYPNERGWKRTSKTGSGVNTVRTFNSSSGMSIRFEENNMEVQLYRLETDLLEHQLKQAAAKIKHCGDYGQLYFNVRTKEVFWCAADSDGGEPLTTIGEIKALLKLPGVSKVQVEAECSPDEDDPDWKDLGRHGIEISPW